MAESQKNMTSAEASPDQLQDLYRQLILDHARSPANFRRLDDATHKAEGINPLCGDKIQLYLLVDEQENISQIGFEGSGCAISMASTSLMTQTVSSLSINEARDYVTKVTERLTGQPTSTRVELSTSSKLRALDGVRQYPSRVKCATLAWHTLNAALDASNTTTTTE